MTATKKAVETRKRIFSAAISLFNEKGFQSTTMRDIAIQANVAIGAAYYYFDSKESIVMAFYEQSQNEIDPAITLALSRATTFESRLQAIIQGKFDYLAPNRKLLGALSTHADPQHPLSPFSAATAPIRNQDIARFESAVKDSKVKLPANLSPYLPRLLWMYQMGLIFFWVYDSSPNQRRTAYLYAQTQRMVLVGLTLIGLPFLKPIQKLAADLLKVIYNEV